MRSKLFSLSLLLSLLPPPLGCPSGAVPEPAPVPPTDRPDCADPFVRALAEGARQQATAPLTSADYGTGSQLFDLEWLFGTWMMAAMGLGQHAFMCPSEAGLDLPAMEIAIERMLGPEGRAFDASKWKSDVLGRLAEPRGSIAWLGYAALPVVLHHALVAEDRFASSERDLVEAIARRFSGVLVETYPGEWYPVDNCAALGALALHDRITGEDHGDTLARTLAVVARARDPQSGLLHQSSRADGSPVDAPRGSGTFLASWFLRALPPLDAHPGFAASLYTSGRDRLAGSVLGVQAMREYPEGWEGRGDIDSGPLILGYSVSSTGFALGGAVAWSDRPTREAILSTIRLGGPFAVRMVPGLASKGGGSATGSHLGDAILLAMRTADALP